MRENVIAEALIYPDVPENWPETAVASVFCALSILGDDPRPFFDTEVAISWLTERQFEIPAGDLPFAPEDLVPGTVTDWVATGGFQANQVTLTNVTILETEGGSRQLNLHAYVLASTN